MRSLVSKARVSISAEIELLTERRALYGLLVLAARVTPINTAF